MLTLMESRFVADNSSRVYLPGAFRICLAYTEMRHGGNPLTNSNRKTITIATFWRLEVRV